MTTPRKSVANKAFHLWLKVATALLLSLGGCLTSSESSSSTSGASGLTLSPSSYSMNVSDTVQFTTTGGGGTYTYSLQSGSGSVTTGGLYTAPATATTAEIEVTDSNGVTGEALVSVTGASLTVNLSSLTVTPGEVITLVTTGGSGNYTYTNLLGVGTLSGTIFTAPDTSGTEVEIQVTDTTTGTTATAEAVTTSSATVAKLIPDSSTTTPYNSKWPISNLTDGIPTTCYSSGFYSNSTLSKTPNVLPPSIILDLGDPATGSLGYFSIDSLNLTARTKNEGFPKSYRIEYWNQSINGWSDVTGSPFSTQPDFDGVARLTFTAVVTNKIAVVGEVLGQDEFQDNALQICEVSQ